MRITCTLLPPRLPCVTPQVGPSPPAAAAALQWGMPRHATTSHEAQYSSCPAAGLSCFEPGAAVTTGRRKRPIQHLLPSCYVLQSILP